MCNNCECPPGTCEDKERDAASLEDANHDDRDRAEAEGA